MPNPASKSVEEKTQQSWDLSAEDAAKLASIQTEIKAKNETMLGRQRLDLEEGVAIGRLLNEAQPIVKKIKPKILWADFVKTHCGFKSDEYARRLKLLARWIDESPEHFEKVKNDNLTEAMRIADIIHVHTVTIALDDNDEGEDQAGNGQEKTEERSESGSRGKGVVTPVFNPTPNAATIVEQEITAKCHYSLTSNWRAEIMALLADEKSFEKHARKGLCFLLSDKAAKPAKTLKEENSHAA